MNSNTRRQHLSTMIIASCVLAMFFSCESKTEPNSLLELTKDDFIGVRKYLGDSIPTNSMSRECAKVCYNIDKVQSEIAIVNNPSSLIEIKKQYEKNIAEATNDISQLDREEQLIAIEHQKEADEAYRKACRSYEVPASGVIANLENLIRQIDEVQTKDELRQFQECRIGMLSDLDNIHLCVESNSHSIPKVKKLAQNLKIKYEDKKHQFGIQ